MGYFNLRMVARQKNNTNDNMVKAVLPDDNGGNPFFQKLKIRINPYTHKSVYESVYHLKSV